MHYEPLRATTKGIAVAYAASINRFLDVSRERVCAKVDALALREAARTPWVVVDRAQLHCLGGENLFDSPIEALGGKFVRSIATCSGVHEPVLPGADRR